MKHVMAGALWAAILVCNLARSDAPPTPPSTPAPPQATGQPQEQAQAQAQAQVSAAAAPVSAGYSATALYNSANAYARAGKPGLAVLNYERAKLLDPNDPDIEANLNRVRQTAALPPQSSSVLTRLTHAIRPEGVAWIGFLGLLITGASLLSRELVPKHRGKLLAAALIGFCLLGIMLSCAFAVWPTLQEAVVVGHSVQVRVSPTLIEEPLFVLPEADIVSVSAEHDGFMLVRNSAGRTGWAPNANLARIVPKR
jgi:hypothetical protein